MSEVAEALETKDDDRLLTRADLREKFGVCSATLRRWAKDKKLPTPDVNLSQRTQAWRLSTLRAAGLNLV